MFLFPPRLWIGGILYVHTHRLMGTVVGMLSIALAIVAWKTEQRKWVRQLAYAVLGAVIFQGILGGLRVVLVKLDLAIVHACFAQAFFCLATSVSVVTSEWWLSAHIARDTKNDTLIWKLGLATCIVIYLQLVAGAVMRHYQAGLAIPDVPLAYGKILPPTDAAGLERANTIRAFKLDMDPVTLPQIWIHFTHRIGALLVTIFVLALSLHVIVHNRRHQALFDPAVILLVLLATQITLGILTVYKRKPADIATSHVAVGALTLVTAFVLTLRAWRLYGRTALTPSVQTDAMSQSNYPSAVVPA
jgi:cytochrome c oxidase assembly protein subunit 15